MGSNSVILFLSPFSIGKFLKDGWKHDLRFKALFNIISVISGRWLGDNERVCDGTLFTVGKISASSRTQALDQ